MSRRTERVGNLIRHLVAETIQNRLSDPRIPTITSVTRVEVSDDFSVARVYVSVMAPEPQRKLCLTALRRARALFRRILAPELSLRKIPALDFRLDDSLRQGFQTVEVIDRAMRELGQVPEWEREEEETVGETESSEGLTDELPREPDPGPGSPSRSPEQAGGTPTPPGNRKEGA